MIQPFNLGRSARRLVEAVRRTRFQPPLRHEPPLLSDVAPEFAAELAGLLHARGEPLLARSVATLSIVELCPCNEPRCASFYAIPRFVASWRWPQRGTTLDLAAEVGTIKVDVAGAEIISVEVLDRPGLGKTLKAALGSSRFATDARLHRED